MALSLGSLPVGVANRPALRRPDFPRGASLRGTAPRGRLADFRSSWQTKFGEEAWRLGEIGLWVTKLDALSPLCLIAGSTERLEVV